MRIKHQTTKDGRRNNGGARRGAGRPSGSSKFVSARNQKLMQGFINQAYYGETVVVLRRYGNQMRRVRKSRFEAEVDELVRYGLVFQRGHKRQLNKLMKIAEGTLNYDLRDDRLSYLSHAIRVKKEEIEKLKAWKIERRRYVLPSEGQTAYEIQVNRQKKHDSTPFHIDKTTGRKVWHERAWQAKMGEGMEKILRERARRNSLYNR